MKMGKLIAIEGPDTAGKTTVIKKLKIALPVIFKDKTFFTREPGDNLDYKNITSIRIRNILLEDNTLSPEEQAQLFAISRRAHLKSIIKELKAGNNVITDRFILSSLAYQGLEIGYDKVLEYNKETIQTLKKENVEIHNIVMTINEDTYNERISKKNKDAMEQVSDEIVKSRIDFHQNVKLLEAFDFGTIYSIDANKDEKNSLLSIINTLNEIIE